MRIIVFVVAAALACAQSRPIVIKAARMFDGVGDRVVSPGMVVVLVENIRGDVGAPDFIDVGLRNAIASGSVVGLRMLVATNAIGATGGFAGFRFGLFGPELGIQDGVAVEDIRATEKLVFVMKEGVVVKNGKK